MQQNNNLNNYGRVYGTGKNLSGQLGTGDSSKIKPQIVKLSCNPIGIP